MRRDSSRRGEDVGSPTARHREVIISQTKTRQRVRDLAEVYTNEREVNAMLDLVPDMFPSPDRPLNIGSTFLEPACGAGNFLVAILDRKLAFVKYGMHYRTAPTFEAMRRVCRPGGLVAARDSDYSAFAWWPAVPELDEWFRVYQMVARSIGAEPDAGRRLKSWVMAAGMDIVAAKAGLWCYSDTVDVAWWAAANDAWFGVVHGEVLCRA